MTILLQGAGLQATTSTPADPGDQLRAAAVAYWKMDESSGTRIDATLRGNDLTELSGTVNGAAGKINNCAVFNPAGILHAPMLTHAANADLSIGDGSIYVCGWALLPNINNPGAPIIGRYDGDEEDWAIEIFRSGGLGTPYAFDISLGSEGYVVATTFGNVPFNQWMMFEFYCTQAHDEIGVAVNNGAFDTSNAITLYATNVGLFVGGYQYQSATIDLDEILIAKLSGDGKPTQAQRDYLWNSGAGRALFP